ncbi:SpoIIE family protein phosphatase [uncultured Traorella sp.]|uniref:SpoIIE family protein phosphatase n=1 Tax=uncultured Traorella sp. TaxID=1929048 RepID=UPI0025F65691|nr:SpoIIE family protein phosphatase [uncultured Traorella sp.]
MDKVHVETYYASLNKKNEELCGDKVKVLRNDKSCTVVLSDGLGSGVKANVLATLTSEIIATMLNEGAELSDAIETIINTLPVCSERKVAYSTFTVCQVFYDGRVFMAEYDGPEAIVLRNGRELKLEKEEIYQQNKKVKTCSFTCEPNDRIIFFSDGIVHAGIGSILNLGWDHKEIVQHIETMHRSNDTARKTCMNLLLAVNDLYQGMPGDDSTVAVVKMLPPRQSVVVVGPPANKEDDTDVVMKLMKATGKKIVCGGSTSQMVARVLNEEIRMPDALDFLGDIPPIAFIDGIDLVTEGAITLKKVLEYLRECNASREYLNNFMDGEKGDGAFLLTHMLICDCSAIHFIQGKADNIAHASINYSPISLGKKIRTVEKIGDELKKLGKIVTYEQI